MKIQYIWLKIVNKIRNIVILKSSTFETIFIKLYMKILFVQFGKGIRFFGIPKIVKNPASKIEIGNNCTFRSDSSSNLVGINRKCAIATFRENAVITIGNHVLSGANVLITDFDWHQVNPKDRLNRTGESKAAPIKIEDNVWFRVNAAVLKGVTIGTNTIVRLNIVLI